MAKKISFFVLLLSLLLHTFSVSKSFAADTQKVVIKCLKVTLEGAEETFDAESGAYITRFPAKSVTLTGTVTPMSKIAIYISILNNREPAKLIGTAIADTSGNFSYTDTTTMKAQTMYVYTATMDRVVVRATSQNQEALHLTDFTPLINPVTPGCNPIVGINYHPSSPTQPASTSAPVQNQPEVERKESRMDPWGYVFDSVSLEPIIGAEVTLLGDNKLFYADPYIPNPVTTGDNGKFTFLTTTGTYFLHAQKSGFTFPANNKNLAQSKYTELYFGDPITVTDHIEHRDIPVDPIDPTNPYKSPVRIVRSFIYTDGTNTFFTGEVSHPSSLITVKQGEKKIAEVTASDRGFFDITAPNSSMDYKIPIDLIATKPASVQAYFDRNLLTAIRRFFQVFAQNDSGTISTPIRMQPIVTDLKGYALDAAGFAVPNAHILLIDQTTGGVLSEIDADSTGYFFVSEENTPTIPYYVEVNKAKSQTPIALWEPKDIYTPITDTPETKSAKPMISKSIKPLWPKTTDTTREEKLLPPPFDKTITPQNPNTIEELDTKNSEENIKSVDVKQPNSSGVIFTIILFLLLFLILGVFIYKRRKKETYTPPQNSSLPDNPPKEKIR